MAQVERTDDAHKRVLVLAYFFPPLAGAGVQRSLKFTKYLPEYGWEPTVITTSPLSYPARTYPAVDWSLHAEIEARTRVLRVRELPLITYPSRVLSAIGWSAGAALAAWPDPGFGFAWAAGAFWPALEIARRERFDAVFSTSAPYSAHLLARAVARRTGLPWVADFRDEWAANPALAGMPPTWLRLAKRAEHRVARDADRLVFAAEYFSVAGAASAKVTVIPNGIDPDDFPAKPTFTPVRDRLRLAYVGSLYGPQNCSPVFAALERLASRGTIAPEDIELRVVGNNRLPPDSLPRGIHISETGYVEHSAAVAEMQSADALLAYIHPSSRAPSGKLYEYLASGRPVLCVARSDGEASGLVRELQAGWVADPHDQAGIEQALCDLLRDWNNGTLTVPRSTKEQAVERFSRSRLTGVLAGVLSQASELGRQRG